MFWSYKENNLEPLFLSAYILIIVMVINIIKKKKMCHKCVVYVYLTEIIVNSLLKFQRMRKVGRHGRKSVGSCKKREGWQLCIGLQPSVMRRSKGSRFCTDMSSTNQHPIFFSLPFIKWIHAYLPTHPISAGHTREFHLWPNGSVVTHRVLKRLTIYFYAFNWNVYWSIFWFEIIIFFYIPETSKDYIEFSVDPFWVALH